ncbi:MAG: DUF2878 family protein [Pirellulales bacterium]|nr:DUF2878 family protein [Pirellulales bacterium]
MPLPEPGPLAVVLILRTMAFLLAGAASLWGAASGRPLLGPAVVAALLVVHAWTLTDPVRQLRSLLAATVIGTALESTWIALGAYVPAGDMRGTPVCPLWVTSAWLNAVLFWQGVAAERLSPGRAAGAGAIAFPLAYLLADRVHAIVVVWPPWAFAAAFSLYGAIALGAVHILIAVNAPRDQTCLNGK